jgi:hypothetical protein
MFCVKIQDGQGNILEQENIRSIPYPSKWKRDMEHLLAQEGIIAIVTVSELEEKNRTPQQVLEAIRAEQVVS